MAVRSFVPGLFLAQEIAEFFVWPGRRVEMVHEPVEGIAVEDEIMPRYVELIYNGYRFSPERHMLQALIDKSQDCVEGIVRLKLYKGSAAVVGRKSPMSLYSLEHVTFEEDSVYDQRDAAGFIKLNALRLRLLHRQRR